MPGRPQDSARRVIWATRISHAHGKCAGTRLWATHWLTVVHGGRHSGAEPRDRESEIIVLAVCGMVDSLRQETRRVLERRTEPIRMEVWAVKKCVRTKMYREGRCCWSIGCRKSSWRIGNRIARLECVLQTDRCAKIKAFSCQAHTPLQATARSEGGTLPASQWSLTLA